MNEQEAKTKWCPFARINNGIGSGYNRPSFPPTANCIGRECMAWKPLHEYDETSLTVIGGYCSMMGQQR